MRQWQNFLYPVLAAGLVVPAAHAADEITVYAQRRAANIQDVPIAVTAISGDEMEKLQINAVADIAKNVPNMQTYTVTAGGAAMQVFMRGAGVQNPGFNASEAPVGIYIDDVYRGRVGTANLELADIDHIEVLRGPQGTLYGRNTIAGAVKIITRTPGEETYANGSVGLGSFNTYKVKGAVGGEVADGLGASFAGLYNKRADGWIKRGTVGGRDLGEYEDKAVRTKLNWFGGDVFSAVASLEYVDVDNDGYNGIPYASADNLPLPKPDFNPAASPGAPVQGFYDTLVPDLTVGFGATKQANSSLDLSWALSSVTVRSLTSYSRIKDNFKFDLNGGVSQCYDDPANPFDGPCLDGAMMPVTQLPLQIGVAGLYVKSLADNKTFTQEISVSGDTDSFNWIAGAFYMKEKGQQDYRIQVAGMFPSLFEDSHTDTTSYALFGEGTWAITDRFSATAGVRFTRDEKDYSNSCTGGFCNFANMPWTNNLSKNFNETTPRLLLQYQLSEDTMVYGSVSRGFQAGGFQTLCFGNQACNQVIYKPQTVVSWETGIKSDLLDDKLRINASVFLAEYSNLQQTSIDTASNSFPLQNVGGVDVPGIELEAIYSPLEGLDLWTTIGLADESFDSSTKVQLPGTTRLPGMPHSTVRAGVDYRVNALAGWDLLLGADLNYASDYFATINNVLEIDSYTRYNGRIGLEQTDGHWSVILTGSNLTDENDLVSGIAGNGTNIRTVQEPREYMLTANYRY